MTRIAARFVTSAAQPSDFPPPSLPEIAVVGRSNVGKSSLINALVGQPSLARTSRTPGRTRLVNWFEIDGRFFLVDLPGYGYAEVSQAMRESWRPLIEGYLTGRTSLAGVLLLIDIRRGVQDEELDFAPWLDRARDPGRGRADQGRQARQEQADAGGRPRPARARPGPRPDRGLGAERRRDRAAVARRGPARRPAPMIIAPATPADLDAIDEIERHSFARPWPRSTFEAELRRPLARLDVARAPAVIGFCNYWIVPEPGGQGGEVHIHAIATHPDHRRAGVGAALLAHALAEGRAAGCQLATLEVRRGNAPAIALYERAGFRTVHVRARYYQDNGEDALVMVSEWSR